MIELLLQAERSLSMGLVDEAERVYRQASEADPRNSIAVVGLAKVALERGEDAEAWRQGRRALAIDPENAAARRIVERLEEVWRHQGVAPPDEPGPASAHRAELLADAAPGSGASPAPGASAPGASAPGSSSPAASPAHSLSSSSSSTTATPRRGIVARLLGRKRP